MGRPLELPHSPRDPADASPSSSSSEEEEEDHGWVEDEAPSDDDENWVDPSGGVLSRVFTAAEAGDAEQLTGLLQGLEVSFIDTRGADSDTAIHLAALYGHADCVRLLLERGARADVADADGALPLHDAAAGGYLDICTMLLDAAPLTIDRGDSEGDTALHNAARGGHAEVVQLLLARGADAALQNDEFKAAAAIAERGTPMRQLLEQAQQRAAAAAGAAAAGEPAPAPPAAEVA